MIRKAEIMGVSLHEVDMTATLKVMELLIETGKPHLAVTLSSEMLLELGKNSAFKEVVHRASLVVPDAEGVRVWGQKLGLNLPRRVSGIDILEHFFPVCMKKGYRVFLLGGKPGVAEKAAEKLTARYPGLVIAGVQDGYFKEDLPVAEKIKAAKADFLVIGMGSPRQEMWFERYRHLLGVKLAIGVGGSLDVLAGNLNRAPEIYRKLKLEWMYRLLLEPGRIKRVLPLFTLPLRMMAQKPQTPENDLFLSELTAKEEKL